MSLWGVFCFVLVIQVAYKNVNLMCRLFMFLLLLIFQLFKSCTEMLILCVGHFQAIWAAGHLAIAKWLKSKHKGLKRMLHVLCCPIKISIPFNLSSVSILFQNDNSQLCFSFCLFFNAEIFLGHRVIGVKHCMVEP